VWHCCWWLLALSNVLVSGAATVMLPGSDTLVKHGRDSLQGSAYAVSVVLRMQVQPSRNKTEWDINSEGFKLAIDWEKWVVV